MNKRCILLLVACFATVLFNHAQGQNADSLSLLALNTNMSDAFYKAIGSQSRLYNGPGYELNNNRANNVGNPYFRDTTGLVNGAVAYDGIVYTNVPLIYDLYHDLLVSHLYNSTFLYELLSDRVTA